jgi:hypothetical protein
VTDHYRVLEIERFEQFSEVIGIGIHFVAVPRLAGPAMPAAVVGDAAIAAGREKKHLRLPGIRTQRPAVAEGNDGSCAPVFVINLCSVAGGERAHVMYGGWFTDFLGNLA